MSCTSCTKLAKERARLFDEKKAEAIKQAYEQKETMAVCKQSQQGEFFVCTAREAIANRWAVLDFVSNVQ